MVVTILGANADVVGFRVVVLYHCLVVEKGLFVVVKVNGLNVDTDVNGL